MKDFFLLILKGVAMGAANVIPGVSGGTVAFITGIYERLIGEIKAFDLSALSLLLKGKWRLFFDIIDIKFLSALSLGIVFSVFTLAKVIQWLFGLYKLETFGFFFGLIVASVIVVAKQIQKTNFAVVFTFVLGVSIAVSMAFISPATPNPNIFFLFFCGVISACSMILPGLSGSYVLLLLGNYFLILEAISSLNFFILLPLGLGVVVGLIGFSKFLAHLFAHWKNLTIASLSGFVTGSLLVIWPWKKERIQYFNEKEKVVGYFWDLPNIDKHFFMVLLFMMVGFFVVYLIEKKYSSKI